MRLLKIVLIAATAFNVQAALAARNAGVGKTENCLASKQGSLDKPEELRAREATATTLRNTRTQDGNQAPSKGIDERPSGNG